MKQRSELFFGIWILIVQFLGIPSSWKSFLFSATGVFLVFSYLLHYYQKEARSKFFNTGARSADTFTENGSVGKKGGSL